MGLKVPRTHNAVEINHWPSGFMHIKVLVNDEAKVKSARSIICVSKIIIMKIGQRLEATFDNFSNLSYYSL